MFIDDGIEVIIQKSNVVNKISEEYINAYSKLNQQLKVGLTDIRGLGQLLRSPPGRNIGALGKLKYKLMTIPLTCSNY